MLNRILLPIFLIISQLSFGMDREDVISKMVAEGRFEEVIEGLQPILDQPNCQPYDYSNLIYCYLVMGDYSNGLIYSEKWINKSLQDNDTINLLKASSYKTMALISLHDLERGIESAFFTLRYADKKDSIRITTTNLRLGLLYHQNKQFDLAYETYRKIDFDVIVADRREFEYYANFANIYDGVGKMDSSIYCAKQVIEMYKEAEDWEGLALGHSNIGATYIVMEDYKTGIKHLDSTKLLGLDDKNEVFELVYQNYYTAYTNINEVDSAFVYVDRLKHLQEFHFQEKLNQEIYELKNSYDREDNLRSKIIQSDLDLEKSREQLLLGIILVLLILILSGGVILFLRYKNLKASRDHLLTTQRLLRSQITPHFLYNSLSTIQGMILNDERKVASNYLSKFSRLVRLILNNSRYKVVSLADELEAIVYYLDLQNARFSEMLDYSIQLGDDVQTENILIPPMLIQPFVENCIEHGFKNLDRKGEIKIQIFFEKHALICVITDNGVGVDAIPIESVLPKKESISTGITLERLALLAKEFKTKASLEITDRKKFNAEGTIVTLEIPYKHD